MPSVCFRHILLKILGNSLFGPLPIPFSFQTELCSGSWGGSERVKWLSALSLLCAGYFTRYFRACGGCRCSLRRCHPRVPHTDHQPGSLGEGMCCTSTEKRKGNEGLTLLSLHYQWKSQITTDFFFKVWCVQGKDVRVPLWLAWLSELYPSNLAVDVHTFRPIGFFYFLGLEPASVAAEDCLIHAWLSFHFLFSHNT